MKVIYMVRHAKSSWANSDSSDFERPLNERGKKDATDMALRLVEKKIIPDALVSSPAKRAKKTCKSFCETLGIQEDKVIYVDKLYLASAEIFYDVINNLDDQYNSVVIFSHNPGITDFVNQICCDVHIDDMPTCSVFAAEIAADKWCDFKSAEKKFLFFDYPKSL